MIRVRTKSEMVGERANMGKEWLECRLTVDSAPNIADDIPIVVLRVTPQKLSIVISPICPVEVEIADFREDECGNRVQ